MPLSISIIINTIKIFLRKNYILLSLKITFLKWCTQNLFIRSVFPVQKSPDFRYSFFGIGTGTREIFWTRNSIPGRAALVYISCPLLTRHLVRYSKRIKPLGDTFQPDIAVSINLNAQIVLLFSDFSVEIFLWSTSVSKQSKHRLYDCRL